MAARHKLVTYCNRTLRLQREYIAAARGRAQRWRQIKPDSANARLEDRKADELRRTYEFMLATNRADRVAAAFALQLAGLERARGMAGETGR